MRQWISFKIEKHWINYLEQEVFTLWLGGVKMTLCNLIDINCLDCPYYDDASDGYNCVCPCYFTDKNEAIQEFEAKIAHYKEILDEIKRSGK